MDWFIKFMLSLLFSLMLIGIGYLAYNHIAGIYNLPLIRSYWDAVVIRVAVECFLLSHSTSKGS